MGAADARAEPSRATQKRGAALGSRLRCGSWLSVGPLPRPTCRDRQPDDWSRHPRRWYCRTLLPPCSCRRRHGGDARSLHGHEGSRRRVHDLRHRCPTTMTRQRHGSGPNQRLALRQCPTRGSPRTPRGARLQVDGCGCSSKINFGMRVATRLIPRTDAPRARCMPTGRAPAPFRPQRATNGVPRPKFIWLRIAGIELDTTGTKASANSYTIETAEGAMAAVVGGAFALRRSPSW